jgi:hypothetical protein
VSGTRLAAIRFLFLTLQHSSTSHLLNLHFCLPCVSLCGSFHCVVSLLYCSLSGFSTRSPR